MRVETSCAEKYFNGLLVGWLGFGKKKKQPLKPTYLYPGNHFEVVKIGQRGSVQLNLST